MVNAQEEPTIPPANDWYQSELAPLFGDKPWDRAAELSAHFSETIQIHGDSVQTVSTFEWLTEVLQELKIAGWIRSEIADVDSDQLNSTTVAFNSRRNGAITTVAEILAMTVRGISPTSAMVPGGLPTSPASPATNTACE